MIWFFVEGRPIPGPQTHFARKTAYSPKRVTQWKHTVAVEALAHRPDKPYGGPVHLSLNFLFAMPQGWPKWRHRAWMGGPHTSRPDRENLEKPVADALTGIMWEDDAQVTMGYSDKHWARKGGVLVCVRFLDPLPSSLAECNREHEETLRHAALPAPTAGNNVPLLPGLDAVPPELTAGGSSGGQGGSLPL